MKIAIASSSLPPGLGISSYVDEIGKWFQNHGIEITVFVTDIREVNPRNYEYPVHVTKIPISQKDEYPSIKEFYDAMLDFMPDALLINDCIYASNILPSLPSTCIRASVVHGYRLGFGLNGHRLLTTAAIHNHYWLDWVVAINRHMQDGLITRYGIPSEKVKLLYNGMEPLKYSNLSASRRFDETEKTILFAGGSNFTKGWDILLKAAKILMHSHSSKWKLIWVGGEGAPPKVLKKSGMLGDNIEWKGKLTRSSLIELLGCTHILAMPSRAEACPMLLLEGLSRGAVPVVSDCPSAMMEIVNDSKCGIVTEVGNAKELAKGLSKLLSQPKTIYDMSTRAQEFFMKNLHIDFTGNKLLDLLTKRRTNFSPQKIAFPFGKIYPFHRRPYKYSKWNPFGFHERWKFIFGILPPPLKYQQAPLSRTDNS